MMTQREKNLAPCKFDMFNTNALQYIGASPKSYIWANRLGTIEEHMKLHVSSSSVSVKRAAVLYHEYGNGIHRNRKVRKTKYKTLRFEKQ